MEGHYDRTSGIYSPIFEIILLLTEDFIADYCALSQLYPLLLCSFLRLVSC